MSGAPYLSIEALAKSFGSNLVLAELSLTIAEGEIFALLGPSGSGKTTALRLLAGFETPDRGAIRVAGEEVTRLPPASRRFGMVFQHYALFPHLSVGENVAFGLAGTKEDRCRRVREALALVELSGFEERPVTALSGGQQQRVALARALAPEPRVLLLDEPLSNLDPTLRERTRRAIRAMVQKVGITTILVTHEQEEAFDLGDRVGLLGKGRLEQVATPEDLYQQPASRFAATFIGRGSFLGGTFTGPAEPGVRLEPSGVVWAGVAAAALAAGAAAELFVRPESLALAAPGAAGSLAGRVTDRRYTGASTLLTVALPDGVEVEVSAAGASTVRPGDAVGLALDPAGPEPRIFPQVPP